MHATQKEKRFEKDQPPDSASATSGPAICIRRCYFRAISSAKLDKLESVSVGAILHGSKTAFGDRRTHTARIPPEMAPIT